MARKQVYGIEDPNYNPRKAAQKRIRERIRNSVLSILGDKCIICEFSDKRALHIDHINGGGYRERKEIKSVTAYYKKIINSVLSGEDKYQLLCANCNFIKKSENKEFKIS